MNSISFSIIVPFYNSEEILNRNLNNIYFDNDHLQYIFINDGSKDNGGTLLSEFCKNHSNVEYYEIEHGGVSCARNLGIKKAVGKYIMFCDIDDGYEPNAFTILQNKIIQQDDIIIF